MNFRPLNPALICASIVLMCSGAWSQTATMIDSRSNTQSYTFANAAGFSISNNGTLQYDDAINQLTGSPCCISATLTVDGTSTTITPSTFQSDTGIMPNYVGGNTLSSKLEQSTMPVSNSVDNLGLQYMVIIGGVTRVGVKESYTLQEKVDSQSLSIFPSFQPSVFP